MHAGVSPSHVGPQCHVIWPAMHEKGRTPVQVYTYGGSQRGSDRTSIIFRTYGRDTAASNKGHKNEITVEDDSSDGCIISVRRRLPGAAHAVGYDDCHVSYSTLARAGGATCHQRMVSVARFEYQFQYQSDPFSFKIFTPIGTRFPLQIEYQLYNLPYSYPYCFY